MWLTNSISSAHRLHLSAWFPHGSAQSLSCCVITCLQVTSGISSETLLDPSPDKSQNHLSVRKEKDTTIPNSLYSSALYLLATPLSTHGLGPAEKCKFNCQGTFSLPWAPLKEKTIFKHFFQGIHCVVQGSKGHFGPRGALVPLCWGALGHSMAEEQKLFIATGSFSCSCVGCGKDGTALSRLNAASCCPAQKI